ncbi:MAG: acyltransferase, partial [Mucilaginibacter sp.]
MKTSLKLRISEFKEKLFADFTELPNPLSQTYLPALDGLRGISIIIVISSHFAANTALTDYFYGDIGVEIFFVISGFLITTLLLKEKIKFKRVSLKKFYVRRALRIVPVSYLFLTVMLLLNHKLTLGIPSVNFLASYTYLRNLPLKDTYEWYTGHFWSLSVEEQFYLCFPFFIVTSTNKFLVIAVLLIAMLPVLSFLGFNNVSVFYSNRIIHVITFAIITMLGKGTASILVGALYAILVFKKIIVIERIRSNFYMSFILLIVACLILT